MGTVARVARVEAEAEARMRESGPALADARTGGTAMADPSRPPAAGTRPIPDRPARAATSAVANPLILEIPGRRLHKPLIAERDHRRPAAILAEGIDLARPWSRQTTRAAAAVLPRIRRAVPNFEHPDMGRAAGFPAQSRRRL